MSDERSIPPIWRVTPVRELALDRAQIMGVLNVTPDSFSDGGKFASIPAALGHAVRMIEEGAAIIDVGGESTHPGASRVDTDEQIRRTVPVIEQLRAQGDVLISIDTTRRAVAEAALDAGADLINDVSAGLDDPAMFALAAERGCGLVIMHRLRQPAEDSYSDQYVDPPFYDDVVARVREHLVNRSAAAEAAGVARCAIVIDPGLGFGKTVAQNYELLARLGELQTTGYPALCAASRKSFLGAATGAKQPRERVVGSAAASVAAWFAGVRLFRVHDVAAHREALAVAAAIAPADSLQVAQSSRI